ncbi:hypothetical protein C497_03107 [Halalkalicoccus jeotgali B3]|uniref:Uncharacterized protein n=2 Tax=Halalkalicoccus jeotgali TaxID=413810 RepID=D8J9C7_HALJB|nr:hypothetical protein HacjB3_04740 [Halalkalicoccus jeotgali B3]ELY40602.1 hypothetical protein C497_03107 [Halalkalicoccus jeotgali B3]
METDEDAEGVESTVDYQIEELIDRRTEEIEERIDDLQADLEEVDNYARISLGERRVKGTEANLAEFSESLTDFADRTFTKTNALESQLEIQRLLLAEMLEALAAADIEVDVSDVEQHQEGQLVMSASPEERLHEAMEKHSTD